MSQLAELSAIERITSLLDEHSFMELNACVSEGVITGYGLIQNRLVYIYSQDVHNTEGISKQHIQKIQALYQLAEKKNAPIIACFDCKGVPLAQGNDVMEALCALYQISIHAAQRLSQISVIFGTCAGSNAILASLSDFVFQLKQASFFLQPPNTLDQNHVDRCNTASASFCANHGLVDFVAETEGELIKQVRQLISFLPSKQRIPIKPMQSQDDPNRKMTKCSTFSTDCIAACKDLVDDGMFLQVKQAYAPELVTGFAYLYGYPVGIIANAKERLSANACHKMTGFVKQCDAYHIPVITLTNIIGYQTTIAEEERLLPALQELIQTLTLASIPKINCIVGAAYGSAAIAMQAKQVGSDLVFALEGTRMGTMPMEFEHHCMPQQTVVSTAIEEAAKKGFVDRIIAPETLRQHLCYAIELFSHQ